MLLYKANYNVKQVGIRIAYKLGNCIENTVYYRYK